VGRETISHKTAIPAGPEYGSERAVSRITNRSVKTLQKDRLRGRGFPYYRFGRQILYDLNEVRAIIQSGRVDVNGGRAI